MSKLIYFNRKDLVDGVNQSQLVESVEAFVDERKSKLIDAVILSDRIEFTKAISEENELQKGYALVFDVPEDFEN